MKQLFMHNSLAPIPRPSVRVFYRQVAKDDIICQFRYYLVTMSMPEFALRFRHAVKLTLTSLPEHPLMAPCYPLRNHRLQNLRSWPVAGFDAVRIYYIPDSGTLRVIRILHQKRDVRRILSRTRPGSNLAA